ncbi:HAD family hydrolase [Nocardiopsis sp. CNT312]|uniref:HAD family hydrolase n=1 Tax=Nocardiopsis sp. CNT312 TaxID=1137268 RepID=UPI00048B7FF5|nr:HAD family hydrolase [Nocardiopsis sp. CNT312]
MSCLDHWPTPTSPDVLRTVQTVVFSHSALSLPGRYPAAMVLAQVLERHGVVLAENAYLSYGQAVVHQSAAGTTEAIADLIRWLLDLYHPRSDLDPLQIVVELFDKVGDAPVEESAAGVVTDLLKAGYRVLVATNTCRTRAQRRTTLDAAGLEQVGLVASSEIGVGKPHRRFYERVWELAGEPHRVLWVGTDRDCDATAPARFGAHALLLARGWSRPPTCRNSVIDSLEALRPLLLGRDP